LAAWWSSPASGLPTRERHPASAWIGPLARAPRRLDRIAAIVQRGDLRARVRLLADEQDVRTVTRLLNRVVLAGLGGIVGVLSVMLLGTGGGPPFTGDTSLVQVLRLLRAVLRHRADPAGDRGDPPRWPQLTILSGVLATRTFAATA
jgi:hypothetical protein